MDENKRSESVDKGANIKTSCIIELLEWRAPRGTGNIHQDLQIYDTYFLPRTLHVSNNPGKC
jgi:hypothetical protein